MPVLNSCTKGVLFREYKSIPQQEWAYKKPLIFAVPASDTVNKYNIYLNVRNSDSYDFSNLYLFIDIISPTHAIERDTFECILADRRGRWLGNGLGDLWDNRILFKQNARFSKSGTYTFILTQGMRVDTLPMLMDAGISIELAAKPN